MGIGLRTRLAKSDAHNIRGRLKVHEEAVLLFAKEPLVPSLALAEDAPSEGGE